MTTLEDMVTRLHQEARPDQLAGMAHYGMAGDHRLGLSKPTIRRIGKELGCDHPEIAAPAARWIVRDVLRELESDAVQNRLARRKF